VPLQDRTTIVHGDYRLDNMIFYPDQARVKAVLDWELSTLGDPLADFTYLLMNWVSGPIGQIADLRAHGIPSLEEAIEHYCGVTDRSGLPSLNWYFAYNAFRSAAIAQGIVGRVRDGTAHHPEAAKKVERVTYLAKAGWAFAERAGA